MTDHSMVLVRITDPEAPFTGPGRWVLPTSLLSEAKFQRELQNLAQDLERGLQEVRGRQL